MLLWAPRCTIDKSDHADCLVYREVNKNTILIYRYLNEPISYRAAETNL